MAEIDQLSIGIEAEAPKAVKTIDSLVGKLDILVKRLSAVTTTPVKINIDTSAVKNINTLKYAVEKALGNVDINTSKIGDKLAKGFGIAGNRATEQISKQFSGILENAVDKFDGSNIKVSGKAIAELAENIAKSGKVARGELTDSLQGMEQEYRDFYDYFNNHKIYVSDFLKTDIGKTEFADLLKTNLSNIVRDATKGIDLNSYWEELTNRFPSILPQGVDNSADQVITALQKINEVREQIKPISIQELVGKDYEAALKSVKDNIVNSLSEAKMELLNEANKIYNAPQTGIAPIVEINEDAIATQIQSAIRRASKLNYEPIKLNIDVDTKKINADLKQKFQNLNFEEISSEIGKLNIGGLNEVADGINGISAAMNNFSANTKTADFSRLARNLGSISNIDTSKFSEIASNMLALSTAFSNIGAIDTSGITDIANSLSKFGGKNAIAGADNLIKVADKLSQFVAQMNGIGSLTFDVSSLANLLSAINKLGGHAAGNAAKNLSPISAQIQNLVRQLNNIGSLSFDTTNLSDLVNAISKLGGKKVTVAITNIPLLSTALSNLINTLSRLPAVSQNTISLVQALANLAAQGTKVGAASTSVVNGLKRTSSAMNRTKKSAFSLAAAFGKFYATYFLVIRGIKGFMRSIESTTDYIEAFNYYNVAFGKIASEWDKDFEKYGYENAEGYAESFTKRMGETLGKLSGVQVNLDTGLLEETGLQNLGLNIQQITQYASQLASVTNSIGQTGEVSLAAAKSMTMLAGDISSLFNVDYQSVANNLQSGLIGQSRALYKYGIDITNATLANYAYNLGLEKSVSEMTQAEKMQLRMIAILDQSKVSWGDLANTINSPSNMLRQFTNNAKELSMVFGQLFIPVLQKVMPIINGITIALKRLLVSFAQILGINIDFESFGQGYSEMEEGADGLSESLGGVADSAKKAKAGLRAFDELKVINMPDTSAKETGGGAGAGIDLTDEILKATEEYEKVWNEAFAKMENTAQAWADKIEKALDPIKKIFQDFAIGDFFQAGKDVSALVVSITDFFADAIDKVDWYGIGQDIGEFLAGIEWTEILKSVGNLIWQAINAAVETWEGMFDAAPIETAIITAIAALKFTGLGTKWFSTLSSKMSASIAGKSIGLVPTIIIAAVTWKVSFDIGKEIGKLLFPEDAEWYDNFHWFGEGGFFDMSIEEAWNGLIEWAKDSNSQLGILINTKERLEESGFKLSGWIDFSTGVVGTLDKIKGWDEFSEWFEISVSPWFSKERWSALGENIKTGLQSKSKDFFSWWKEKGAPDWFSVSVSPIFSYGRWSELGENIKSALSEKWINFTSWWNEGGAQKWFETSVSPIFSVSKWNFSGIADGLSQAWENAVTAIKGIWNKFVEWINEKLDFSWSPVSVMGKEIVPGGNIKLGKVGKFPQYATGGFPEDGLFYANHNELIGEFTNGKTVVINNEQIIQGLADAVYPAVYNAVSSAMKNNGGNQEVKVVIESNNSELFRVVQDEANKFTTRTQKPAFNM